MAFGLATRHAATKAVTSWRCAAAESGARLLLCSTSRRGQLCLCAARWKRRRPLLAVVSRVDAIGAAGGAAAAKTALRASLRSWQAVRHARLRLELLLTQAALHAACFYAGQCLRRAVCRWHARACASSVRGIDASGDLGAEGGVESGVEGGVEGGGDDSGGDGGDEGGGDGGGGGGGGGAATARSGSLAAAEAAGVDVVGAALVEGREVATLREALRETEAAHREELARVQGWREEHGARLAAAHSDVAAMSAAVQDAARVRRAEAVLTAKREEKVSRLRRAARRAGRWAHAVLLRRESEAAAVAAAEVAAALVTAREECEVAVAEAAEAEAEARTAAAAAAAALIAARGECEVAVAAREAAEGRAAEAEAARAAAVAGRVEAAANHRAEVDVLSADLAAAVADLATSRSLVEVSRIELETSRAELEKARSLIEVSVSEVEVSRTEVEASKSELETSRSLLEVSLSEAEVFRTELEKSRSLLETSRSKTAASAEEAAAARLELAHATQAGAVAANTAGANLAAARADGDAARAQAIEVEGRCAAEAAARAGANARVAAAERRAEAAAAAEAAATARAEEAVEAEAVARAALQLRLDAEAESRAAAAVLAVGATAAADAGVAAAVEARALELTGQYREREAAVREECAALEAAAATAERRAEAAAAEAAAARQRSETEAAAAAVEAVRVQKEAAARVAAATERLAVSSREALALRQALTPSGEAAAAAAREAVGVAAAALRHPSEARRGGGLAAAEREAYERRLADAMAQVDALRIAPPTPGALGVESIPPPVSWLGAVPATETAMRTAAKEAAETEGLTAARAVAPVPTTPAVLELSRALRLSEERRVADASALDDQVRYSLQLHAQLQRERRNTAEGTPRLHGGTAEGTPWMSEGTPWMHGLSSPPLSAAAMAASLAAAADSGNTPQDVSSPQLSSENIVYTAPPEPQRLASGLTLSYKAVTPNRRTLGGIGGAPGSVRSVTCVSPVHTGTHGDTTRGEGRHIDHRSNGSDTRVRLAVAAVTQRVLSNAEGGRGTPGRSAASRVPTNTTPRVRV